MFRPFSSPAHSFAFLLAQFLSYGAVAAVRVAEVHAHLSDAALVADEGRSACKALADGGRGDGTGSIGEAYLLQKAGFVNIRDSRIRKKEGRPCLYFATELTWGPFWRQ